MSVVKESRLARLSRSLRCLKLCLPLLCVFTVTPVRGQEPDNDGDIPTIFVMPETPQEIMSWSRTHFHHAEYDALESGASMLRTSKAEYRSGDWQLTKFYYGLAQLPTKAEDSAKWVASAREWVKRKPASITARVALAEILTTYAWQARGDGYAHSVSEEEWELFNERLSDARLVLREAKVLKAKCPHWWAVAQTVGRGQNWSSDATKGLLKEALSFEPNYTLYLRQHLINLLPRWGGKDGEALAFAIEQANSRPGEQGDLLYGRLILELFRWQGAKTRRPEIVFEKMDKGFTLMAKNFKRNDPVEHNSIWALLCRSAGDAKDEPARKAKARTLIAELEAIEPRANARWRTNLKDVIEWAKEG